MNTRKLIITADDFGLCDSVNDAIIDGFLNNNITNTSIIINMPNVKKNVDLLLKSKINYGLHFSINRGIPSNKKSSLCDASGNFLDRKDLFKKILSGKIKKKDIKDEFDSQIELCHAHNLKITHFDSDNHIHTHPFIFFSILESIMERNLSYRSLNPLYYNINYYKRFLRQIIFYIGNKITNLFIKEKLLTNDFFCSAYDNQISFNSNELLYRNILRNIKSKGIIELMVHPYYRSEELNEIYPKKESENFLNNCFAEANILTKKKNLFHKYDLELTSFSQLRLEFE